MPAIELVPVPIHTENQPYHHVIDNIPLSSLITRILVVNDQVDINTAILTDACGTAGTLSNRLNQSMDENGNLLATAVDETEHSIEAHTDSDDYVRMTAAERSKLAAVESGANNLDLTFYCGAAGDTTAEFESGTVVFKPSGTIAFRYQNGYMYADWTVAAGSQHTHYHNVIARPENVGSPDYINYVTGSPIVGYKAGSLRVYLNGIRLNPGALTYVPKGMPGTVTWTAYSYTEGTSTGGVVTDGDFALSAAVDSTVKVYIDFDVV